jgi:nucleoside phosphorylase
MNDLDLTAHIINFDSDDFSTHQYFTIRTPRRVLSPIPWPAGEQPAPHKLSSHSSDKPLPPCDVLIVTWTVEEAKALSDVLTPGFNSKTGWYSYTKNFDSYKPMLTARSPAKKSNRLGSYFVTKIKNKTVLCFKSELHMSTDGIELPVQKLWQQIIPESAAGTVITTGTAGGIGTNANLGDVAISGKVRFDCTKTFKKQPFAQEAFVAKTPLRIPKNTAVTKALLAANRNQLPVDSPAPAFFDDTDSYTKVPGIVTTDFFAFDNKQDTYKLQELGSAVEMGDAVLAMVVNGITQNSPAWICVRNASDPQIKDDVSLEEQKKKAAQIYEQYGYWTTVCSAIACWALVVGN